MATIGKRQMKAWEKFNEELKMFGIETEGTVFNTDVTLYEDANTTRQVRDFRLTSDGILTWIEDGKPEKETMFDEDDAKDWLNFWKGCLRRAKRYWSMNAIELDRLQDCETNEEDEEESQALLSP